MHPEPPLATSTAPTRRLIILGSTGSIGTQTIEVIEHLNALHAAGRYHQRIEVVGLVAGRNAKLLTEQAQRLGCRQIALCDPRDGADVPSSARSGIAAAEAMVREVPCDMVVAAMVGAAGLPATLAAVELGRTVALANKETLVAAGSIIVPAARASGSALLPVDSEHSAIWQCLLGRDAKCCPPLSDHADIARIVLTASGGALRHLTKEQAEHATPEMTLKHPTWNMGAKVTIDSASLTNKAFEIIEAHWLFGTPADKIGVLIHPQSIVHSMVEFADFSVMAQLSPPDMRLPIQLALTFPHRPAGITRRMDWAALRQLDFAEPQPGRYPALDAAFRVICEGGTSGAIFNGAGEVATQAFLDKRISFGQMGRIALEAIDAVGITPARSVGEVLAADGAARRYVTAKLAAL